MRHSAVGDNICKDICHLLVGCGVNPVAEVIPPVTQNDRGGLVAFAGGMPVLVIHRCVGALHDHGHTAEQCPCGSTSEPDVNMGIEVTKFVDGIGAMAGERVKQIALVFLDRLAGQTVIAARLQQTAILLIPLFLTYVGEMSGDFFQADFLKTFHDNAAHSRYELAEHLRTVLANLIPFGVV